MEKQLWPTVPSGYLEPGVPDFPRWGEAAPLLALSERLHSEMCALASEIDDFGTRVSDPEVVNHLVIRLAGTGLSIAEILHSVSGKLDRSLIDLDHWLEVLERSMTLSVRFAMPVVQRKPPSRSCAITRRCRAEATGDSS